MPSFIVYVELATSPPDVTWGPHDGAVLGEELVVPYISDGMDSAAITLNDGRVLAMTVGADDLRVDLPFDTPDGAAVITAMDDVGNTTTQTIMVSGVAPAPDQPPVQVGAYPPVAAVDRIVSAPSGVAAGSNYNIGARVEVRSLLRVRSRYTAPGERVVWTGASVVVRSRATIGADIRSLASSLMGAEKAELRKRPEGPQAEDELVFLGLL
jgi:hypothetical protein